MNEKYPWNRVACRKSHTILVRIINICCTYCNYYRVVRLIINNTHVL